MAKKTRKIKNEIRKLNFPENEYQIEKYVLYSYIIKVYVYILQSNLLCGAKYFHSTIFYEDVCDAENCVDIISTFRETTNTLSGWILNRFFS